MSTTTTSTTKEAPRFTGKGAVAAVILTVAAAVAVAVAAGFIADERGFYDKATRGSNNERVLANTISVWLALAGLAHLTAGVIQSLLELQRIDKTANVETVTTEGLTAKAASPATGIIAAIGNALASLKGSSALIFSGVALLITTGLIANGSLGATDEQPTPTTATTFEEATTTT